MAPAVVGNDAIECLRQPHLKHGDNCPEERVKVLPVGQRVSAVLSQTEFAAEQMHSQDAATATAKHREVASVASYSLVAWLMDF